MTRRWLVCFGNTRAHYANYTYLKERHDYEHAVFWHLHQGDMSPPLGEGPQLDMATFLSMHRTRPRLGRPLRKDRGTLEIHICYLWAPPVFWMLHLRSLYPRHKLRFVLWEGYEGIGSQLSISHLPTLLRRMPRAALRRAAANLLRPLLAPRPTPIYDEVFEHARHPLPPHRPGVLWVHQPGHWNPRVQAVVEEVAAKTRLPAFIRLHPRVDENPSPWPESSDRHDLVLSVTSSAAFELDDHPIMVGRLTGFRQPRRMDRVMRRMGAFVPKDLEELERVVEERLRIAQET